MSNSPLVTHTVLSPNHSGKRNHAIDTITIHCFVGQVTAKRGCEVFSSEGERLVQLCRRLRRKHRPVRRGEGPQLVYLQPVKRQSGCDHRDGQR